MHVLLCFYSCCLYLLGIPNYYAASLAELHLVWMVLVVHTIMFILLCHESSIHNPQTSQLLQRYKRRLFESVLILCHLTMAHLQCVSVVFILVIADWGSIYFWHQTSNDSTKYSHLVVLAIMVSIKSQLSLIYAIICFYTLLFCVLLCTLNLVVV